MLAFLVTHHDGDKIIENERKNGFGAKKMHFWPFWAEKYFFFYATPIYRGGKHYENFRVPQILLVESIFRCFGQKITPVGRFWVPFQQYQKFGFPYYRAKKKLLWTLYMGIKTYQEKNTKPMEIELNPTYQWGEKSQKPSENTTFLKYGVFGWFFGFFSSLVCRIEL